MVHLTRTHTLDTNIGSESLCRSVIFESVLSNSFIGTVDFWLAISFTIFGMVCYFTEDI